jgi:hypothetical protein
MIPAASAVIGVPGVLGVIGWVNGVAGEKADATGGARNCFPELARFESSASATVVVCLTVIDGFPVSSCCCDPKAAIPARTECVC